MTNPILETKLETFLCTVTLTCEDSETNLLDDIEFRETISTLHNTMAGMQAIIRGIQWAEKHTLKVKAYRLSVYNILDLGKEL